jgi:PST family polysaccharide transporter
MSLKQKTVLGMAWSAVSQAIKQIAQFVITVILARLLTPHDFGLIGIATVIVGFFSILSELGLSGALIQKQNADDAHYSSAFWLNVIVGFSLTGLTWCVSPFIADFYQNPELILILNVLSVTFIFSSLTIVQQALLTKTMNFRALTIRDIIASIVSGCVGVFSALLGWGVWSLILQALAFSFLNSLLLWVQSPWRPKLIWKSEAIKDIFHFSAHMSGFNIVNYLSRNTDALLIGKFLGSEPLGLYTVAYKLMLYPVQNITWVINKVMFPAFASIQNDIKRVSTNYLKSLGYIALLSFPAMALVFFIAPELIDVVYGPKWYPVIYLVQIFALTGALQSISSTIGVIYQSQGRADIQFKYSLFFTLPSVALSIWIGLPFGINGVATSYTVRTVIATFVAFFICKKLIDFSWKDLIQSCAKGTLIAVYLSILVVLYRAFFLQYLKIHNSLYLLSTEIVLWVGAYIAFLYFSGIWSELRSQQFLTKKIQPN